MADRGGKSMTVDRLKRDLLNKLINARIDLAAYLQLRKAKGYMSVSESEHLRDNLFELCNFMREKAPALQANYGESELSRCAAPPRCSPLQGYV
jgi:biofilm regulator BssR